MHAPLQGTFRGTSPSHMTGGLDKHISSFATFQLILINRPAPCQTNTTSPKNIKPYLKPLPELLDLLDAESNGLGPTGISFQITKHGNTQAATLLQKDKKDWESMKPAIEKLYMEEKLEAQRRNRENKSVEEL